MTGITKQMVKAIEIRRRETAETCPKHPDCRLIYIEGLDKVKPFCEQCRIEKTQEQNRRMHEDLKIKQTKGFLRLASLVDRPDIFRYTFDGFKAEPNSKEAAAKHDARLIAGAYSTIRIRSVTRFSTVQLVQVRRT